MLTSTISLLLGGLPLGCGRRGDPIPRARTAPEACTVRWSSLRLLEIQLPTRDALGDRLLGVERVRLFYLPLGNAKPSAEEVLSRGQVLMERSRPNLPAPGGVVHMDLRLIGRPPGWLVAVAVRVGNVVGAPSEPVAWLDPRF